MATMSREIEDERLYEYCSLIVQEFEKAALHSGQREGIVAVLQSPLNSMDMMLRQSRMALGGIQGFRDGNGREDFLPAPETQLHAPQGGVGGEDTNTDDGIQDLNLTVQGNVSFDADINEALNNIGLEIGGRGIGDFLKDCAECDLRASFDWQVKPVNLLAPINAMIDNIEANLKNINTNIDPFSSLRGICDLLNAMKSLCLPDILAVLGALKMLLRKYLGASLKVRLDWTMILGPIIKAIVQGVSSLLGNIEFALVAPVDCALGALTTARKIQMESREILTYGESLLEQIENYKEAWTIEGITKDISWNSVDLDNQDYGRAATELRYSSGTAQPDADSRPVGVGFEITERLTIPNALANPDFPNAPAIDKLLVPLNEANMFIREIISDLKATLRSLEGLTANGMTMQVSNTLSLLLITDAISVVLLAIKLFSSRSTLTDWCTVLEENPGLLQETLRGRFGQDVSVQSENSTILLTKGPDLVGQIHLCSSARSEVDNNLLNQWINDLNREKGK